MVNTKHAVNAPRENIGTINPQRATLRKKFFKNDRIQSFWADFQQRNIITGRNIEESFKPKYRQKMLEPARALGWSTLVPFPKNVYSDLHPQPHEDQPSQESPPDWFIKYFGQLRATMERIEKTQEENNEYMKMKMERIEQRQILNDKLHELHGTYIDHLGDNYEQLYTQQMEFQQECLDRLITVQTLVEAESHFQYNPHHFSPHSQELMNLKGTKRSNIF
ncbi:hypothetical protein Acr_06g0008740 [Actinidia rufa]|uniref:Uncharacterized protein n=1 Tax=Actinidia rufa TaxID=165716 RepID=A0A7J0ER14_9ERIC|nr:hypothetical protein Acr_06g0008740 [Actinidia rufa]